MFPSSIFSREVNRIIFFYSIFYCEEFISPIRGEEPESDLTFHKLLSSVPRPARFSASSKSTPETHAESANSKFTEASVTPLPMITAFSDGTTTLVTCLEQDVNGITSYIRGSSNFQSYFEGTVWTYGEVVSGDIDMFGFDDQGFPAYFVGNVYINGSFSGNYRYWNSIFLPSEFIFYSTYFQIFISDLLELGLPLEESRPNSNYRSAILT